MMKLTFTAIVALLSLAACADKVYEWPQLSEGTLPDTEVATNIPLRVNAERLDVFCLRLQVSDETASEVLVAVGHDADENGDLSEDETAFVFGDDCGERYLVDCQEGGHGEHRTPTLQSGLGPCEGCQTRTGVCWGDGLRDH